MFRRSRETAPATEAEPEPLPGPSGLQNSVAAGVDPASDAAAPDDEGSRGVPRRGRGLFSNFLRRARKMFKSGEPAPAPQAEPEAVPGTSGLQSLLNADISASKFAASRGNPKAIYGFQETLAKGSFGVVQKAIRGSDWTEVVIKSGSKPVNDSYIVVPGHPKPLYREVALLVMLRRRPVCPYLIEMYEWFDRGDSLSIVLEYPQPCVSLKEFISVEKGVSEDIAYIIMRQLVKAVIYCIKRKIFYQDINPRNVLVNTRNPKPKVKLIDFSSARLLDNNGYDSRTYTGAVHFQPPEAFGMPRYHAIPTNVWSLGILLFTMLMGRPPFLLVKDVFAGQYWVPPSLDDRCKDLIGKCLKRRPEERLTLQQISRHRWMSSLYRWVLQQSVPHHPHGKCDITVVSDSPQPRRSESISRADPDSDHTDTNKRSHAQAASGRGKRGFSAFFRRARKMFRRSRETAPATEAEPEPLPGPSGLQNSVAAGVDPASDAAAPDDEGSRGIPRRGRGLFSNFLRRARKMFKSGEPAPAPQAEPEAVPGTSGLQSLLNADISASKFAASRGNPKAIYGFQETLAKGSFGVVQKAIRGSDWTEVVIKSGSKPVNDSYIVVPGHPKPLYREVALLVLLRRRPVCPYLIEMYEWFDRGDSLSIVLEYPQPCVSLKEFISVEKGVSEDIAYIIMRQLVKAVIYCIKRKIFYQDINPRNVLVNTRNPKPKVKLIDFSSARLLDNNGYDSRTYTGAVHFQPPEAFGMPRYHAIPTNVWSLGILLFTMLMGRPPFLLVKDVFAGQYWVPPSLDDRCKDLIRKCLKRRPEERLTLQQISRHRWMSSLYRWVLQQFLTLHSLVVPNLFQERILTVTTQTLTRDHMNLQGVIFYK
ncbi:hypothetical protein DNTS_025299 [Danionella cerebrum]|uniref:non-specific serine/threonine protein kinase n=1 Tax=Danionella cerebrum TaxID=2873325 RepID=A0A553QEH9_9TELE|nr:hypothetical protein DNTS_025299 [Danionella translucida]